MALQPEQIIEKIAPIFTQGIIIIIGIAFVMIVFKLILKSIFKPKEKRYMEYAEDKPKNNGNCVGIIIVLILIIVGQTNYILNNKNTVSNNQNNQDIQELKDQLNK